MSDLDAMRAATRVLRAVVRSDPPDQADIELLRRYAPVEFSGLPDDELACAVIQRVVADLKLWRKLKETSTGS